MRRKPELLYTHHEMMFAFVTMIVLACVIVVLLNRLTAANEALAASRALQQETAVNAAKRAQDRSR